MDSLVISIAQNILSLGKPVMIDAYSAPYTVGPIGSTEKARHPAKGKVYRIQEGNTISYIHYYPNVNPDYDQSKSGRYHSSTVGLWHPVDEHYTIANKDGVATLVDANPVSGRVMEDEVVREATTESSFSEIDLQDVKTQTAEALEDTASSNTISAVNYSPEDILFEIELVRSSIRKLLKSGRIANLVDYGDGINSSYVSRFNIIVNGASIGEATIYQKIFNKHLWNMRVDDYAYAKSYQFDANFEEISAEELIKALIKSIQKLEKKYEGK